MLPSRVGLDQAVGARVLDRRQDDRRLRLALAVQPQHGAQIDLRQHVAVEDDDRLGQRVAGVADRAAGAERHRLDDVAELDAEAFAFAEDLLDAARLVVQAEDHLVDLRHLPQQIDLVVEKRPVEDRHDRLRRVDGQRPQARALAAGEQNGFHDNHDHDLQCARSCGMLRNDAAEALQILTSMNLPNALTPRPHLPRAAAGRGAADEIRGPADLRRPEGARRRRDLRPRVADRLAGRLPGAPAQAGHDARPADGSAGRQAADHRRAACRWCRWTSRRPGWSR